MRRSRQTQQCSASPPAGAGGVASPAGGACGGEVELTDIGERGARRPRSGVSERDARDMLAGWQAGRAGCVLHRQAKGQAEAEQCGTLWHVPLFCSLWEKQASVRKICEGGRPDDTASWGQPVMFRGGGKLGPRRYIACARYGTRSCPPAGAPVSGREGSGGGLR